MSNRRQDVQPQTQGQKRPAAQTGVNGGSAPARVDQLPDYRVLLHSDDVNDLVYMVETICDLTSIEPQRAAAIMMEAQSSGVALVLTTHRERAELYVEQFACKKMTVTIEPTA